MCDEWPEDKKFSHIAVNYVSDFNEAQNNETVGEACGNCVHMVSATHCEHVKTPIRAAGWCELYQEK